MMPFFVEGLLAGSLQPAGKSQHALLSSLSLGPLIATSFGFYAGPRSGTSHIATNPLCWDRVPILKHQALKFDASCRKALHPS